MCKVVLKLRTWPFLIVLKVGELFFCTITVLSSCQTSFMFVKFICWNPSSSGDKCMFLSCSVLILLGYRCCFVGKSISFTAHECFGIVVQPSW